MERRRWKLIAGDVFRAPIAARSLAVYVGSGTHLLAAASTTLLAAAAGAFSAGGGPTLATAAMCLYFGLAAVGGAAAVALLRSTQREATGWPLVCLKTACYFPGATRLTAADFHSRSKARSNRRTIARQAPVLAHAVHPKRRRHVSACVPREVAEQSSAECVKYHPVHSRPTAAADAVHTPVICTRRYTTSHTA